jgi:hypothetical protein
VASYPPYDSQRAVAPRIHQEKNGNNNENENDTPDGDHASLLPSALASMRLFAKGLMGMNDVRGVALIVASESFWMLPC